jgi:hypothetical protein
VQADLQPAVVKLRATYQGSIPASIVAGHWARDLADSETLAGVRVTAVSGSGRETPAVVELEARLK